MGWNWGSEYIANQISEYIPFLASAVIGRNGVPEGTANDGHRWYWENYRRFQIEFFDVTGNVPQCSIQSSVDDPLTGNNVVFNSWTIQEGG